MTTDPDIGILAATAYETGISPIDYAARDVIQAHIEVFAAMRDVIGADPDPCPGCWLDATPAVVARQILGDLLDAGWIPPEVGK
jgi:hypothetical protein